MTTVIHTSVFGISSNWLLGGRDLIKRIFFPWVGCESDKTCLRGHSGFDCVLCQPRHPQAGITVHSALLLRSRWTGETGKWCPECYFFSLPGAFYCITNLLYSYTSQHTNVAWSHMMFLCYLRSMKEERINWFSQKASESFHHYIWHTWIMNVPIWGDMGI